MGTRDMNVCGSLRGDEVVSCRRAGGYDVLINMCVIRTWISFRLGGRKYAYILWNELSTKIPKIYLAGYP